MKNSMHEELIRWGREMQKFHLPRWNELPEIELYMDQLVILIERYLASYNIENDKIITPAMVNNYVKLKLIPPPIKKRYNRIHLAYLLAITLFKQVFSLSMIHDAINQHAFRLGEKTAYNLFCEKQEAILVNTLSHLISGQSANQDDTVAAEDITITFATQAVVNKLIVQKSIYLQNQINFKKDVLESFD